MNQHGETAEGGAGQPAPPFLELRGIRKTFGGVVALNDVTLTIARPGVVHALAGENGSGKSTLLGILSGQLQPDAGSVWLDGEILTFRKPADAVGKGICMVSQETSVALDLTVAENVLLGRLPRRRGGSIDRRQAVRIAGEVLDRLDADIEPRSVARDLRPDQLQIVEMARAISMDAKILILDEPTSSLTDDETEALLRVVKDLRAAGVTTIFVSHRMGEVFALADEITVLRDGLAALSGPAEGQTRDSLVSAMLGPTKSARASEIAAHHTRKDRSEHVALEVVGLTAPGEFEDVTLMVRPGEIVGLAGLEGAGRSALLEALFGARTTASGTVSLRGRPYKPVNPRAAVDDGVAYLPPDRKRRGLVLSMGVRANASVVGTLDVGRVRPPPTAREKELLADLVAVTRLRMGRPHDPVSTLSGGNQQKIALGKWLVAERTLLLLDEPTRGVDVGAKLEIHHLLRRTADKGAAVLVSSSENEELLAVCDRILVMARRRVVAELDAREATLEAIVHAAREGTHDER